MDPAAVAEALAPFADTIATAHENGQTVGLDNRNRVRISTQGTAMLAFPAVLDDNTIERDRSSLNSAISQLVESTSPTPEELSTITEPRKTAHPEQQDSQTERDTQAEQDSQAERGARAEQSGQSAQSNQSAESNQPAQVHTPSVTSGTAAAQAAAQAAEPLDPTPREIADRLQRFIRNEEEEDPGAVEALPVKDEATPDVEERAGFGARGYSSGGAIVIATFAFLLIIAVAALAAYVFSLFNTNEDTSPVSSDAIHATNTPSAPVIELPVVQILHDARSFPDGPQAPEVIDGDPQTVWESHQPDPALLVTTQDPVILKDLVIRSETAGGKFSVFAVNDITGDDGTTSVTPVDPASVDRDSLPRIATGTLMEGRNNVSLNGRNDFSGGVLIQFSGVEG